MSLFDMHSDLCLAHDIHNPTTDDYAHLFTEEHLAAAKSFGPRKLALSDPLSQILCGIRTHADLPGIRKLGDGTGGTCHAVKSSLIESAGGRECAVKICVAQGKPHNWHLWHRDRDFSNPACEETTNEAKLYKYLRVLQGKCIPTLIDYVEFEIISRECHLPYDNKSREVGWDYVSVPVQSEGTPEKYYIFQAFALILKEVGIQLHTWPAFSKSERAIAAITERLAVISNEVLSCLGDSSQFCRWTRFASRNILWYSPRPSEKPLGRPRILLIDLGKWQLPKSHLDPTKWCSRGCARRARAVQDCVTATRKTLLDAFQRRHDKFREYQIFDKEFSIWWETLGWRQHQHDSVSNPVNYFERDLTRTWYSFSP